jgi:hypothetical protein
MKEHNLKFDKIYDEIPFVIQNTPMDKALFFEYQNDLFKGDDNQQINVVNLLENNMYFKL